MSKQKYYLVEWPNTGKGSHLKRLLAACDGWIEDEYTIIEE